MQKYQNIMEDWFFNKYVDSWLKWCSHKLQASACIEKHSISFNIIIGPIRLMAPIFRKIRWFIRGIESAFSRVADEAVYEHV